MKRAFRNDSGFTIAEYVIAIAILFFVSVSVMGSLAYAANASSSTSKRDAGLALANQRLEQARNLPYDDVGTVGGYPAGTIPVVDTVAGGFTVTTDVDWAIDAASGLSSCKTIRVTVSWTSPYSGSVKIESNIAGKSTIANAGDVKIFVVDADTGDPIVGASVTVKPSTGFTSTKSTDSSGAVRWGKVPAGAIAITGSCPGYALDVAPLASATVSSNQLNTWTIQAVKPSTAVITVRDQSSAVLGGVVVTLVGPSGTLSQTSNGAGVATFTGLLKGSYTVTGAKTSYTPTPTSITLIVGGQTYSGSLKMTKKTQLTVTVTDQFGDAVPGVALSLSPALAAAATDSNGQSVITIPTGGVSYTATASLAGYTGDSGTTGVIPTGTEATLAITITKITDGTLIVKMTFTSSYASSYVVYVYDSTTHVKVAQFTVNKPSPLGTVTTNVTLPAGRYSVSVFSPWRSSAAVAPVLNAGSTASVTVTKSN